ncbi:hypothetical protein GCM10027286_12240 [Virgibacillus ainsalahensis]
MLLRRFIIFVSKTTYLLVGRVTAVPYLLVGRVIAIPHLLEVSLLIKLVVFIIDDGGMFLAAMLVS